VVPLARGEKLGCWALTEPEAGSDAAGMRTRAARRNGGFVLNGAKTFITSGRHADVCVAMALTDASKGAQGISALIVEKGTPGFWPGRSENKLGMRASDTSEVVFANCRVPQENLIAPEGSGLVQSLQVLDGGRISMGALAVGMAQGAYETAFSYATQRKQFGKTLSEFQATQIKLADMATQIEAARLLVYRAAWLADRKGRFTKEASMAKLFASELAGRVAGEAVQILGGYGFIKDYPAEKYYRDAKLCTIGEGTSEIQRLVIARQLLIKKSGARTEAQGTRVGGQALAGRR
jgi:alkylation response protein AidB-like acyl-CoA dehydrogenase